MAHSLSNTQGSQYASAPDSDSDSPRENLPQVNPRSNVNPSNFTATNAVPGPSHIEDPTAFLLDLQKREAELTKCTTDIEKLLLSITQLSMFVPINQQLPGPTTSTPINQPHDNPYNSAFTSNTHTQPSASAPTFSLGSQSSQFIYPESIIREALDLVPKFDGHNISVLQFARACKRAKELIPFMNESYLIRLLRNKLTDHAYLAVEDETHDAVDKFLDSLKRTFGPSRSSNYYRGQLSVNYKKQTEHILDYIGRVKDLRNAIIEGDQALYARSLSITEIAHIDSFTLESFVEGLPAEYRVEIRTEGGGNLKDAYNKAILVSKRLERDLARLQDPRNQQAMPSTSFRPTAPNRHPSNPPVTILQRSHPLSTPISQTPSPHVSSVFPTKICNYCGKMGHLISECRKRQYNNNINENRNSGINRQQGNAPGASAANASRGPPAAARAILPMNANPQPSTSSEPQQ